MRQRTVNQNRRKRHSDDRLIPSGSGAPSVVVGAELRLIGLDCSYTDCIISSRAISTSAISIDSALLMLFADFYSSIGYLRCFVATFSVIFFLGCFLYMCYLNRFSIECRCGFRLL